VVSSVSAENAASSVSQLDAACMILRYLLFTVFVEEVEAGAECDERDTNFQGPD
jgi:hypothetical protein